MSIEEIIESLKKPDIMKYLNDITQIHMYTKHYLLIAEELSESGMTFLQPLKEHRDAYDHFSRILALSLKDDNIKDKNKYIFENIKKALGHEYRAFFDTSDWLTFTCRKYIREELSHKSIRDKYIKEYDYESAKIFINELPFKISKFREQKDVSNENPMIDEVNDYKKVMDELLEIYKNVQEAMLS